MMDELTLIDRPCTLMPLITSRRNVSAPKLKSIVVRVSANAVYYHFLLLLSLSRSRVVSTAVL